MPINWSVDVGVRYSSVVATQGNADGADAVNAGNAAARSLGKFLSTAPPAQSVHAVFDLQLWTEARDGRTEYRCLFVINANTTLGITNMYLWQALIAGGADAKLALDPTANSPWNNGTVAQALVATSETNMPSGLTQASFFVAGDRANALGPFSLGPQECKAFWIQRAIAAGTAPGGMTGDGLVLHITGSG